MNYLTAPGVLESLRAFVEDQIAKRRYGATSESVRELIRRDQDRQHLRDRSRRPSTKPRRSASAARSASDQFAAFLVQRGIDSMSLNPDTVVEIIERVPEVEAG